MRKQYANPYHFTPNHSKPCHSVSVQANSVELKPSYHHHTLIIIASVSARNMSVLIYKSSQKGWKTRETRIISNRTDRKSRKTILSPCYRTKTPPIKPKSAIKSHLAYFGIVCHIMAFVKNIRIS